MVHVCGGEETMVALCADLEGTNQYNDCMWFWFFLIVYMSMKNTVLLSAYVHYTSYVHSTACVCECDPVCALMHDLLPQTGCKHKQNLLCATATVPWPNLDMSIHNNNQ